MKQIHKIGISLTGLLLYSSSSSVTVVYTLRITEATKHQALDKKRKGRDKLAAVTLIGQARKTYSGINLSTAAGLGSFIYSPGAFYMRVDGAVAHVKNQAGNLLFERTQTDDILFTLGYGFAITPRSKLTLSGLFGIPTHKDTALEGVQFGTGHIGTGMQIDSHYDYSTDNVHSLVSAIRLVHFYARTARTCLNNVPLCFKFAIGNLADILIAHESNWKRNSVEFGYVASFGFDARIRPHVQEVINATNFNFNTFYAYYSRSFLLGNVGNAIALGASYGFDSKRCPLRLKQSITWWGSWSVVF